MYCSILLHFRTTFILDREVKNLGYFNIYKELVYLKLVVFFLKIYLAYDFLYSKASLDKYHNLKKFYKF